MAISVSKKTFRRAWHRNLIKRRIREAYRRKKKVLYETLQQAGTKVIFMLIYKGDTIPDYQSVETSITEIIRKLPAAVKESS
jgi:ribonuclease P protein component